jgi:hypothetical protein
MSTLPHVVHEYRETSMVSRSTDPRLSIEDYWGGGGM